MEVHSLGFPASYPILIGRFCITKHPRIKIPFFGRNNLWYPAEKYGGQV